MIYNLYKNSQNPYASVSESEFFLLFAILTFCLIITIINFIAKCYLFHKTEISWWKALVPFYNRYIIAELALGEGYLFFFTFVPFVGWIYDFIETVQLAKAYEKSLIFGILMYFITPLRWWISFDNSRYLGPQRI